MQVEGITADHQSFWLAVLLNEGIEDWCIVQAEDGYCWLSKKIIQLPNDASDSLFLHEVAHALCPDPEPYGEGQHYHGSTWASKYGELVEKYLQRRPLTGAVSGPARTEEGGKKL